MYYALFKNVLFAPIVRWLFRATIEGEENLPKTGGVILAINTGQADPELAYWTHSGELVFMAVRSSLLNLDRLYGMTLVSAALDTVLIQQTSINDALK